MHTSWLSSSIFGTVINCTGFRLKRTCLVKIGEQPEPDDNGAIGELSTMMKAHSSGFQMKRSW